MQPLIGLSMDASDREAVGKIFWLKQNYFDAVRTAGGIVLPLPPTTDEREVEAYLKIMDGLVITGGDFDIHPRHYQATDQGKVRTVLEIRTGFEMQILQAARQKKMPILGVCGGMQLLNVACGGTLHQHIDHHERCEHPIHISKGSLLQKVLGDTHATVNSTHHQAVDRIGCELVVSAKAPDGFVEAIEASGASGEYLLGVQWHPEALADPSQLGIYRGLVVAAMHYAEAKHGQ